jgi:hypothetical protein
MIRFITALLFLLSVTAVFYGCGNNVAGGSGSEAGEAFQVALVDYSGSALVNGRCNVYREKELSSFLPAEKVTSATSKQGDSRIEFFLEYSDTPYVLEFLGPQLNKSKLYLHVLHQESSPFQIDEVVLEDMAVFEGTVVSSGGEPVEILFLGTPYKADINPDGKFQMQVASGDYRVAVNVDMGTNSEWLLWGDVAMSPAVVVEDSFSVTPGEMLFEDFEDADIYNNYSSLLGSGAWKIFDDSAMGGNSTLVPDLPTGDYFSQAVVETDAFEGKSLKVEYAIGDAELQNSSDPFVCLLLSLGDVAFDLSDLDTIGFYAKGNGAVWLQIKLEEDNLPEYEASIRFNVTSEWQEFKFAVDDLQIFRGGNIQNDLTWSDCPHTIREVLFFPTSGTELWLDNIRFKGVSLEDLLAQHE